MSYVTQITAFVMTHDLNASVSFFETVLEFKCGLRQENYAFMSLPGGALRLIEVDQDCDIGEQMIYFDTDNVDGLYIKLRPQLDRLPEGRVRAPFDQPYNMREFHVKDPDNCLLLFGMEIPPSH
ncbi:MAG: VOC family protein [Pseudomonadota bacterium]